jgi:hypothetical protein
MTLIKIDRLAAPRQQFLRGTPKKKKEKKGSADPPKSYKPKAEAISDEFENSGSPDKRLSAQSRLCTDVEANEGFHSQTRGDRLLSWSLNRSCRYNQVREQADKQGLGCVCKLGWGSELNWWHHKAPTPWKDTF